MATVGLPSSAVGGALCIAARDLDGVFDLTLVASACTGATGGASAGGASAAGVKVGMGAVGVGCGDWAGGAGSAGIS